MSFGEITASGALKQHYHGVISYSFKYADEGFILKHHNAEAEGRNSVIIETISPLGHPKLVTEEMWEKYYYSLTPLHVKDRIFCYAQHESSKYWFVQELTREGKFGEKTAEGTWQNAYSVMRGFNVADKSFLLYHNDYSGGKNDLYIQEVLHDGTLGQTTESQKWEKHYSTMVPLEFDDGSTFLFGHSKEGNYWFIQEVSKNGTLGAYVDGTWDKFYDEGFSFKRYNRVFLYLGSQESDLALKQIQEVLPNGTFGEITDEDHSKPFFTQTAPFYTVYKSGFYGQALDSGFFILREIIPRK